MEHYKSALDRSELVAAGNSANSRYHIYTIKVEVSVWLNPPKPNGATRPPKEPLKRGDCS